MTTAPTLRETLLPQGSLWQKALLVLAGTLFIAVSAKISVPLWPAPMSLQTLAILIVGFTMGSRLGAATAALYLAEGAMGLPVFTPTTAIGAAAFVGPTAGFLVGFVAMAWLAGLAAERGLARGFVGTALSAIAISAILYLFGAAWPLALSGLSGIEAGWVGMSASGVFGAFVAPFLLGDVIKSLIVALVVTGGWAALRRT